MKTEGKALAASNLDTHVNTLKKYEVVPWCGLKPVEKVVASEIRQIHQKQKRDKRRLLSGAWEMKWFKVNGWFCTSRPHWRFISPITNCCEKVEKNADQQAIDISKHPVVEGGVKLMPNCHTGYGTPIGSVIFAKNAVLPCAVGDDIGCGIFAVETNVPAERLSDMSARRAIYEVLKKRMIIGEGASHRVTQDWEGFERYIDSNGMVCDFPNKLDRKKLGSLGGGNHFIELQKSDNGFIWLMIHTGSRDLGQRIVNHYQDIAKKLDASFRVRLPNPQQVYLPMDIQEGYNFYRDMRFAMEYAFENRRRMMAVFKETLAEAVPETVFVREINTYHNYISREFNGHDTYYIHRKGVTSDKDGELGVILGSMGSESCIIRVCGGPYFRHDYSHAAGRALSRIEARHNLTVEQCDKAMEDIVFDGWKRFKGFSRKHKGLLDLSDAPQAFRSIDDVLPTQKDLVEPLVRLKPMVVLKGWKK